LSWYLSTIRIYWWFTIDY